jgi:AcrR family transcriptional regulator
MATEATAPTAERPATGRPTARERLLAAANELFYEEGVNTVGIDRVIERAGVAKATLYSAYGSKDGLIRAYLAGRHDVRRRRLTEAVARYDTPREKLLSIFDALEESVSRPGYRGCAFVNATAEGQGRPGNPITEVTDEYRGWVRDLFTDLAAAAGAADPQRLARQLVLLYDGAGISARMDHDPDAGTEARDAATTLIDAATARPR